ncbi:MAG: putative paraquat-inducible protein A [Enterobacterales bacterium]|jgi:uncharacterized paraquat-inducible protein A
MREYSREDEKATHEYSTCDSCDREYYFRINYDNSIMCQKCTHALTVRKLSDREETNNAIQKATDYINARRQRLGLK